MSKLSKPEDKPLRSRQHAALETAIATLTFFADRSGDDPTGGRWRVGRSPRSPRRWRRPRLGLNDPAGFTPEEGDLPLAERRFISCDATSGVSCAAEALDDAINFQVRSNAPNPQQVPRVLAEY